MTMLWLDGRFVKAASVPAFSHALNYATGFFDTVRAYPQTGGTALFRLDDHVARLFRTAKIGGFILPFSEAQVKHAVCSLVRRCGLRSAYVRLNAFFPTVDFRLRGGLDSKLSLAITAVPLDYSGRSFETGLSCVVSSWQKPTEKSWPSCAKFSANYLASFLALRQAKEKGFDEAVLLDSRGFIAEGTAQNILLVKNGVLYTPSERSEILPGVTRDSVIALARVLGLKVKLADVSVRKLLAADEIFLTGTATELMPVTRIGRKRLRVGPFTCTLAAAFRDVVSGRHGFSKKWLTHV